MNVLHLIWIIPLTSLISVAGFSVVISKGVAEKEHEAFENGFNSGFNSAMNEFNIVGKIFKGRDSHGKPIVK